MMFEDFWAADDAPPHSFLNKDSAGLGTGPMGFARALLNYQAAFGCEAVKFYSVEGILAAGKRVADVIIDEVLQLDSAQFQVVEDRNISPLDYELDLLVSQSTLSYLSLACEAF